MWTWLTPLVAVYGAVVSTWLAVAKGRPRVTLDIRASKSNQLHIGVENTTDYPISLYGLRVLRPRGKKVKVYPSDASTMDIANGLEGKHSRRVVEPGKVQEYQISGAEEGLVALLSWRSHAAWRLFHIPLVISCSRERAERFREKAPRDESVYEAMARNPE